MLSRNKAVHGTRKEAYPRKKTQILVSTSLASESSSSYIELRDRFDHVVHEGDGTDDFESLNPWAPFDLF